MEAARNRGRGLTPRPAHLLTLDQPGALRTEIVGAKAAHLAAARRRQLPALPGWVVPITESRPAVQAGSAALAAGSIARARRAAGSATIADALAADLARVAAPGTTLVVRSSTLLDDDANWSGAFVSYADIGPAEITTAVRGCWASVFAPDALERLALVGATPADVGMAVLIQPQVTPTAGGWARVSGDWVEIAAVKGHPGPLLHGIESGVLVRVGRDGSLGGPPGPALPLDASTAIDVARLMREAETGLGAASIEWAISEGCPVILQVNVGVGRTEPAGDAPELFVEPAYARLAATLVGRRGRLADALLAPWAAAAAAPVPERGAGSPAELLEGAERAAAALAAQVAGEAGVAPAELVDGLARHDVQLALRVSGVTITDARPGSILGAIEEVARELVRIGALAEVEEIWWQSLEWVREAVRSGARMPPARFVGDRWGGVLFGAVAANGLRHPGTGASEGRSVGRAAWVRGAADAARVRTGDVVLTARPLHSLAPLLWKAGGLVTMAGSPGAHLFEVARALRVPVVVSAEARTVPAGAICAVDGTLGEIRVWRP